jgi:hypothetical protein
MRARRIQRFDRPRAIREPSQRNLAIGDEVTVHEALAQLMGQIRPALAQPADAKQQAVWADSLPERSPDRAPEAKSSSSTCAGPINAGFSPLHLFPVRAQHTVAPSLGAASQHETRLTEAKETVAHKLF